MPDEIPQERPLSALEVIQKLIKDDLVDSNKRVQQAIVAGLVKEEDDRRTRACTSVYQKIRESEKVLRGIKPLPLSYDSDGKPQGEPGFTKEQVELVKKTKEMLMKLNAALSKALNEKDFTKVFELGQ